MGYAQELFRGMGGFSNFALSFSNISILTGAVTLYDYGLSMGGPAEMAFGWPLVAFFTLAVAASMAELASVYPTSGGIYHWSAILGGPGWGWFTAWVNIAGLVATLAGVDYGCAQFITPLTGLRSTPVTVLAVYAGILISHGLINHIGIRVVTRLNDLSVTVHIAGVAVIVGALLLFTPKQPLSYFWRPVTTSHFPYAWAFLLGLLQAQWTFTGYDASAHVAEETIDPRRRAPWGILNSVVISAVAGYLLLLALTLAIHNLPAVLAATDAGGNKIPAVIAILQQALGSRAGAATSLLAALAMWFCGLSTVTSTSRAVYAFARDRGMPLSHWWRHVGKRFRTPAAAIWLVAATAWVCSVYSGAYSVVTSISTVGIYVSYGIPILLYWRNRRSSNAIPPGPWNLGRWGIAINAVALLWTAGISIMLVMPPNQLAGKTIAALAAGLGLWYILRERHRFKGPEILQRRAWE